VTSKFSIFRVSYIAFSLLTYAFYLNLNSNSNTKLMVSKLKFALGISKKAMQDNVNASVTYLTRFIHMVRLKAMSERALLR